MTALRKRVWKDAEVGELARDTDDAIGRLLPTRIVTRVDTYAEPFFLAMAKEPAAIVLVRCQLDATPETVVACGSRVSFTFIAGKGARVDSIHDLTPDATDGVYRMTFEVIGG